MKKDNSLWEAVAREQDAYLDSQPAPNIESLRAHLAARKPRRFVPFRRAALALLPLAAAAAWLFLHRPADGPNLRFAVDGQDRTTNDVIAAPVDRPLVLQFSDQSRATLQPGSEIQAETLYPDGATIRLHAGSLSTHVQHTERTRWTVLAGVFAVHVTGTRFLTTYHPGERAIEVDLHEGSVLVSGGALGEGVPLRAGQRLTASATTGTFSVMPQPKPTVVTVPQAQPTPGIAPSSEIKRDGPAPAAYPVLASTLLERGDKARYEGDVAQARRAYQTLLDRFPRAAEASDALFALARLAFDSGDMHGAGVLFGRYAANYPEGTFHEQALGRWLEALVREGDTAEARRVARVYIGLYPRGDHLKVAQSCLQADRP